MLEVEYFCHRGTEREENQDRVLVGYDFGLSEIQNVKSSSLNAFVADGVGSSKNGAYASQFVLEGIRQGLSDKKDIEDLLQEVNANLIAKCSNDLSLRGSSTTLSGIIIDEDLNFKVISAGDSEIWIMRGDAFFRINEIHVLDEFTPNSLITSYFGGTNDNLELSFGSYLKVLTKGDILLICTDGLFKAISEEAAKSILKSKNKLSEKCKHLLRFALLDTAPDNISVILVEINQVDK
ncbi:MAG: serine/threonine protein phosphatase PrpC [Maribacter sp.]|jgi:serine/threonine protein phosphatase PrpC